MTQGQLPQYHYSSTRKSTASTGAPIPIIVAAVLIMKRKKNPQFPTEESLRWVYFCAGDCFPVLRGGQRVLVSFQGRKRVAICKGRIPGGMIWGELCAPVVGARRVVVSKHSLIAVESHAK